MHFTFIYSYKSTGSSTKLDLKMMLCNDSSPLQKKYNKICLRTLQNNLVIRLFQCNALHLKLDLRCKFQLSIVPWNNLIRVVVMRYDTIKIIKTQIHGQVNCLI